MIKALFSLLLSLIVSSVNANDTYEYNNFRREELLRQLFKEISKDKYSRKLIQKKFINPLQRTEIEKRMEFLDQCLTMYHDFTKGKDLSELAFIQEIEMPLVEQEFAGNPLQRDVMIVQYRGKTFFYILFNGDKIRALLAIRQGESAIPFFLEF